MDTLEKLQSRIETTADLEGIVRTMKALAAVNIRQYERATESLAGYGRVIESGFRMVLRNHPEILASARSAGPSRRGVLVFGSDQGMCGPLNERVSQYALREFRSLPVTRLLAVGSQVASRLEHHGVSVDREHRVPGSVAGITPLVQRILQEVEQWQAHQGVDQLVLYHARHLSRASYEPISVQLLPVDEAWLRKFLSAPGPEISSEEPSPTFSHSASASANSNDDAAPSASSCLPLITMEAGDLFSALLHHYLFSSLFRGLAESLASENASRLASMRRAEKNIEEKLLELKQGFHQRRQTAVTEEMLDIVGAFEVLGTE